MRLNSPLMALTQLLDGPRGTLEFRQGVETLMILNSAPAS